MTRRQVNRWYAGAVLVLALVVGTTLPVDARQFTAQIQTALMTLGIWPYDGSYANGDVPVWTAASNKFLPSSGGGGGGVISATQFLAAVTPVNCSTAQYAFVGDPDSGLAYVGADSLHLCLGGLSSYAWTQNFFKLNAAGFLSWTSSGGAGTGTPDVIAGREAAGHVFWRNSTNAQRLSIANTYTSATNYEAFSVDWQTQANQGTVGLRTAASGNQRVMALASQASNAVDAYSQLRLQPALPMLKQGYMTVAGNNVSGSATGVWFSLGNFTSTASSSTVTAVAIEPVYNQSGTAAGTDLLINRTQTAVGSGNQRLIDAQVGGVSQFFVTNAGAATFNSIVDASAFRYTSSISTTTSTVISKTAPTVSNGCSGEAMVWNNGTAAFEADMGTSCAGVSTVVFTLPAATNAWSCTAINVTTSATAAMEMTASDTTTATFTNYTRTTGVALTFVDGANVRVSCLGG